MSVHHRTFAIAWCAFSLFLAVERLSAAESEAEKTGNAVLQDLLEQPCLLSSRRESAWPIFQCDVRVYTAPENGRIKSVVTRLNCVDGATACLNYVDNCLPAACFSDGRLAWLDDVGGLLVYAGAYRFTVKAPEVTKNFAILPGGSRGLIEVDIASLLRWLAEGSSSITFDPRNRTLTIDRPSGSSTSVILNRRADHLFHPVEAAYFRGANGAGMCISNIAVNAPRLCVLSPFDDSDEIGPQQLLTDRQLGLAEVNRLCSFWKQDGLLASPGRLASSHQLEARLPNLQLLSTDFVAGLDESDSAAIRSFVERFNRLVVAPILRDISEYRVPAALNDEPYPDYSPARTQYDRVPRRRAAGADVDSSGGGQIACPRYRRGNPRCSGRVTLSHRAQ